MRRALLGVVSATLVLAGCGVPTEREAQILQPVAPSTATPTVGGNLPSTPAAPPRC